MSAASLISVKAGIVVETLIAQASCIAVQLALCVVENNHISRIVGYVYHLFAIGIQVKITFVYLPLCNQRLYVRFDADIYQLFMNLSFLLFIHCAKIIKHLRMKYVQYTRVC